MNKINNPVMSILIIVISMLILDIQYKNQVKNTVSDRNGEFIMVETAEPDQSHGKENAGGNLFASPQPFSEKAVQSGEHIENEGINIKFDLGIVL
jgi:hypothetical protein